MNIWKVSTIVLAALLVCLRAGVSRDTVKRISGHRTDSMYSRYNIQSTADVADAFARVEGVKAVAQ